MTFDEAIAAFNAGERERLVEPLGAAVGKGGADPRLLHLHGLVLRDLGRREEAIVSLRKAAEAAPQSAKIAVALARTLFEAGLPSVEAYGRALALAPGDTDVLAGLSGAFVIDGDPDSAIAGLERIVARSPQWLSGHVILAKLRWAQGERAGFDRSFREATAVNPANLDLWREWIVSLMHADDFDGVLEVIAKGRAAVGEHPLFAANEAIAAAESGDSARAERLFEPLADLDDSSVQVRRVRHYIRTGRPDLADEIIGKWTGRPDGFMFWPYASIAWRMMDDARWQWLEGDDRFVGVYDIADRLPPLDQLAETLRNLHTLKGQPLEQSLRGGTQTDGNLFTRIDPVIVKLRQAIKATVEEHVARFPDRDPGHPLLGPPREPIGFAGSWSVRLQGGGFHANHVHPAGWISSALYVALPPDIGQEQAGYLTLGDARSSTLKIDTDPFRTVEPKPGRLALFPSYMWHGTRPFGEGERLTVAFDVAVPRGVS